MRFCCHEEYRVLTCKTPTKTITSLRKLESLKSNSDNPLRRRMKLCEAKNLRRYCLRVCLTIYKPKINVYNSMSSFPTG
ncbi:hypothetical protein Bca4012_044444 [Brassica carinata]|uniref:Uncharacterized protein n=1 Tax=Brassica oleracea var. oleracea TaxID=109376 RepID=A0A0D3EAC2_BRAOL